MRLFKICVDIVVSKHLRLRLTS